MRIASAQRLGYTTAMRKRPFVWRKPESIAGALERFMRRAAKPEQEALNSLWQHWDMVMGPDIASLAAPLGSKQETLMLSGEDTMALQDISFMQAEILERANAFMGKEHFKAVKVHLNLDKNPLNGPAQSKDFTPVILPSAQLSGKYLEDLPKDSPLAKCYALFVQRSQQNKG